MKRCIVTTVMAGLIVAGCSGAQKLSPMQQRQITTKTIEAGYENVYRATMTVLRDNNYVIRETDMMSGLIVAYIDREMGMGSQIIGALFAGSAASKNTVIEVSTTVDKINETTQEIRMNIQETTYSIAGGKNAIRQITDPAVYEKLFNDIAVETKRREAMGR